MKMQNNLTGNEYSDEWYTDQETVDKAWMLLGVEHNDVIMCPFDTEQSLFVQKAKSLGHKVIYGISDFLENDSYVFDKLITNPPFSIKDKVIEQVYKYRKPAALMLPLDILGGVKRHGLYKLYGAPSIFIPTKRIAYYDETWTKRPAANFHSVIARFNIPSAKPIIFELA